LIAVDPTTRCFSVSVSVPAPHQRNGSYPDVKKKDASLLPFQGEQVDMSIPFDNIAQSTITPYEREVFQRLFKQIVQNPPTVTKTKDDGSDQKPGPKGRKKPAEAKVKPSPELIDAAKLFPPALRQIASAAAQAIEYKRFLEARKEDMQDQMLSQLSPEEKRSREAFQDRKNSETARIETLLKNAKSDVHLWAVLSDNLFDQIEVLGIGNPEIQAENEAVDKTPLKEADEKKKTKEEKLREKAVQEENAALAQRTRLESAEKFALLGTIFPSLLLTAIRELRRRFPESNLVFSILPVVKGLGTSSYALFCTTDLYNELMMATWQATADVKAVVDLLQEMEVNGFEFNQTTLALVRRLTRDENRPLRDPVADSYSRMTRPEQDRQALRQWRKLINDRMAAVALRRANQNEAQEMEVMDMTR
jgi:hypothetical protein